MYRRILKLLENEEAEECLQPFHSGLDDDKDAESGVGNESPAEDLESSLQTAGTEMSAHPISSKK